jgi:hypothetical protein
MEPFVASLVGALAAGAIAAAKDTATQVVKDAYGGVRQYITDQYAKVRLDDLEEEPQSKGQKLVIQEKLEKAGAENDPTLAELAATLVEALESQAPDAAKAAGVDLEGIRAALDIQIRRVGEGGPVRMKDLEARGGSLFIEDVGNQSKK